MEKEKKLPKRKPTRLRNFDYSSAGGYFVTICIRDRKQLLSEIVKTVGEGLAPPLNKTTNHAVGEGLAPPLNKTTNHTVGEGLAPPLNETTNHAVGEGLAPPLNETTNHTVGEGLAPPLNKTTNHMVEEGLAPPEYSVLLKPCGEVVKEQLQLIENRFQNVIVKDFVIMPDHIHAIIFLHKKTGGASPSYTGDAEKTGGASPSHTGDAGKTGGASPSHTDDAWKTGGASTSPTLDDVICAFKSLTSRICKQKYGIEKMFQRSYFDHIIRDSTDYETRRRYIYENPKRWYYKRFKTEKQVHGICPR